MKNTLKLYSCDTQNLHSIVLENSQLSIRIIPALGGKISSLIHLQSGREWLYSANNGRLTQPEYGDSYVAKHDVGGWDECFPCITGEPYQFSGSTVDIPDHGELWCLPWRITEQNINEESISVSMLCEGHHLPYRFIRTLTLGLHSTSLKIDYQLTNLSSLPITYVWSMHPMLLIEPGMRINLPVSISRFKTDEGIKQFFDLKQSWINWPFTGEHAGQELHLDTTMAHGATLASKLYSQPLSANVTDNALIEVSILTADNLHGFGFKFNCSVISHLGLWLNYQGWSGSEHRPAYVLGLEPCIGGADSLSHAKRLNQYQTLQANTQQSWTVECFVY